MPSAYYNTEQYPTLMLVFLHSFTLTISNSTNTHKQIRFALKKFRLKFKGFRLMPCILVSLKSVLYHNQCNFYQNFLKIIIKQWLNLE